MQKAKITQILEHINFNEYQLALKAIDSIFGKEKNKSKINQEESQWLRLLQGVCLAKLSHYGEAQSILQDFLTQECVVDLNEREIQQILENISQPIGMIGKVRELCESKMIAQKRDKDEKSLQDIFRMCLKEGNFEGAQKIANKLFGVTKDLKYLLTNIVFLFNGLETETDEKKLTQAYSLINLFISKLYKDLKLTEADGISKSTNTALARQLVRFHYNVLRKQGKKEDMKSMLLEKYPSAFSEYMEHLDLIEELYTYDSNLFGVVVEQNYASFKKNADMNSFQMVFEKYQKFASFLFRTIKTTDNLIESIPLSSESIFENPSSTVALAVIEDYYCSLNNHRKLLKQSQSTHPHFKNAIKCVLMAMLGCLEHITESNRVLSKVSNQEYTLSSFLTEQYKEIISEYIKYFATIFTFPEELFQALKNQTTELQLFAIKQLEGLQESSAISKCIAMINLYKLKIIFRHFPLFEESQENYQEKLHVIWKELLEFYQKFFVEIYPDSETKQVEKGERLYVDDFLIIAADLALDFLYRQKNLQNPKTFGLLMQTTFLLECGLKKSSYNYDIQLRLLIISILLGNKDRVYQLIKLLDIKSVQYETLGFVYLSTALDISLDEDAENNTNKALQYYIENLRESKEAMISAVKNNNLEKIWEFKAFDEWISRSYFKMMAFFAKGQLLLKESFIKKELEVLNVNVKYFNEFCLQRLASKTDSLVWNFDMQVVQTICCSEKSSASAKFYWNYLGQYNSPKFLGLNITIIDLLFSLNKVTLSEEPEKFIDNLQQLIISAKQNLSEISIDQLSDLSQSFQFRKKPAYLVKYIADQTDLQTTEQTERLDYEKQMFTAAIEITEFIIDIISLTNKSEETQVEAFEARFQSVCNKILSCIKHLQNQFSLAEADLQVFPLLSFKNFKKTNQILTKFISTLFSSSEFVKSRLQKIQKKNGDLKKSVTALQKLIKTESDALQQECQIIFSELSKKFDAAGQQARQGITTTIREAINLKLTTDNQSIFDLASSFPHLKREDIITIMSEEIALNYKYFFSVLVDLSNEAQRIFKAK